ncbi:cytochrome P450 [Streptomyces sp. NPDC059009]|uniref:cytochrome P450 n=1 Tax=Streptomyces sp. NPDC059009 TaxID=3346694 RepID=UPI0036825021
MTSRTTGTAHENPRESGCPHAATDTGAPPPVRDWPALDLAGPTDFDPVLGELMREGPLTRIKLPHGEGWAWLVTRYDDVKQVTNDARLSREAVAERQVTRLAPHFIPMPGAVGFVDPPDHTRLRRAVTSAFSARHTEHLRGRVQGALDALCDELLAQGPPADLTERLLTPFPIAVISEVMGIPAEHRQDMHDWTQLILSSAEGADRSEQAKQAMASCFTTLIRANADSNGEDVVSLLGAAVARGDLSRQEAVGFAVLIQIGGEAVTHNTGQMVHLLLSRPDLWDRLRTDRAVLPRATDELLRFIPHRSAVGLSRIALEDLDLCGRTIRAGEPVYVSYLAANRDPDVFPDPDAVDFDRSPASPHVSFGHGPHYCVGGLVARMQSELLLTALLDRFPGLALAVPPDEVRWRRGALIRGPEALPVTW